MEDHGDGEEESKDNRSFFIGGIEPQAPINLVRISIWKWI
jgi:hypothetical protein